MFFFINSLLSSKWYHAFFVSIFFKHKLPEDLGILYFKIHEHSVCFHVWLISDVPLPFRPSLSYPFSVLLVLQEWHDGLLEFLAFAATRSPAGLGFPHVPTPWQSIWLAEFPLGLAHHTQPALVLISLDEEKGGGWEVSDIGPRVFIRWPLPSHMHRTPPYWVNLSLFPTFPIQPQKAGGGHRLEFVQGGWSLSVLWIHFLMLRKKSIYSIPSYTFPKYAQFLPKCGQNKILWNGL